MDASNVATRLWIGARPPADVDLPDIDVLVLCAEEIQPERMAFHGRIIRCPLPDAALNTPQAARAVLAGQAVAEALATGQRVLVTCAMGINRSSLVAGLALARVTRMGWSEIVSLIRAHRHPLALSNPHFLHLLRQVARDGRAPIR